MTKLLKENYEFCSKLRKQAAEYYIDFSKMAFLINALYDLFF